MFKGSRPGVEYDVHNGCVVSAVCAEVRTDSSSLGDDVNFTTLSTCSARVLVYCYRVTRKLLLVALLNADHLNIVSQDVTAVHSVICCY